MKKVALATALSLFSTIVFAAEPESIYVNVDAGKFILEGPPIFGANGNTPFPDVNTIRVGVGYNITPNLAVEAGYSTNTDSKLNTSDPAFGITQMDETLKTTSFQVAAVYTYDLTDQLGVFGKLGLSMNSLKWTANASGPAFTFNASYSNSSTGAMFGLGAKYNITNNFAMRAQYEIFGNVSIPSGFQTTNFTYRAMTVGGMYTF